MVEAFVFQCQGYYDWEFEVKDDHSSGSNKARILLGNEVIWESEHGYWSEERAQEVAVDRLRQKLKELFSGD